MNIHVGTSGWHYKHWLGSFYPANLRASEMLAWYAARFDDVEINNGFYRLPPATAVQSWKDGTPSRFRFAMKGSRYITHMKKLKDPEPAVEKFFARADILGRKLGPILFQLPPHWDLNLDRLARFLEALPPHHKYSFEFRHVGWHLPEVYRLLEKHRAAFCIYDLAGFTSSDAITANFAYVRLHGPGGKYQGLYSPRALEEWARKIVSWKLKSVYVYFDNDECGYAATNALQLRELLLDGCKTRPESPERQAVGRDPKNRPESAAGRDHSRSAP